MVAAAAALCLSAVALPAAGQSYPSKPIRLVVPFPAGGGTDFFARTVGAKMSETLGQPIVVDNRPGGSTIIGAENVKGSAPDGYTVLLGDLGTYALNPSLFKKLPYDPAKDFAPVTLTGRFVLTIAVNPSVLNVSSVKELIDAAKKEPGKINYASPGTGSPHHLAMELFAKDAGIKLTHVPYKGAAPAIQDLLGGQVAVMPLDIAAGMQHIKSGKIKVIARRRPHRWPRCLAYPRSRAPVCRALKRGRGKALRSRKARRPRSSPSCAKAIFRRSPIPQCAPSSSKRALSRCKARLKKWRTTLAPKPPSGRR
jgi:tripartite-type tricarboxylate transporter receptor subunit TctC